MTASVSERLWLQCCDATLCHCVTGRVVLGQPAERVPAPSLQPGEQLLRPALGEGLKENLSILRAKKAMSNSSSTPFFFHSFSFVFLWLPSRLQTAELPETQQFPLIQTSASCGRHTENEGIFYRSVINLTIEQCWCCVSSPAHAANYLEGLERSLA